MNLEGRKIGILIEDQYEDIELWYPLLRLREAGASVMVLEARDRVGGRLWTDESSGALLELGGQWVSPDQTALRAAIDELGLETFPRYRDGESVYVGPDGVSHRFTGDIFRGT